MRQSFDVIVIHYGTIWAHQSINFYLFAKETLSFFVRTQEQTEQ